jgi:ADP-ribosylglycohydrolase
MADNQLNFIVNEEIKTLKELGYDVSSLKKYNSKSMKKPNQVAVPPLSQARHDEFYAKAEKLKPAKSYPYVEPSDLAGIKKVRPRGPRKLEAGKPALSGKKASKGRKSEAGLLDRIQGAWLGRCVGCQMGKPVEGWPKEHIEYVLKEGKAWPLYDYVPYIKFFKNRGRGQEHFRGHIKMMKRDDDIDYTVINLVILEEFGPKFTTHHVGQKWLQGLQYHNVCTAEKIAYRNLVNRLPAEEAGEYRNPFREWIGAQIRADLWGYVTPGWPEKGAELAHRDAYLSHRANGIYGEMFFAAMISAALVSDDLDEIVTVALAQIPKNCRLSEAVRDTMELCKGNDDWEDSYKVIKEKYGHYHRVHTINNAAIVLMGLVHGKKDLGKTAGIAVMGGWDTDCNGATAGSVLGAMLGAKKLPKKLVKPLNDTVESIVLWNTLSKISDMAKRTLVQAKKVAKG